MATKVYLAARYQQKDEIKVIANLMKAKGIEITSSWLDESHSPSVTLDQISKEELAEVAQKDVDEIKAADIVVLFTVDPLIPTVRGGRHVEAGIAIGLGKPLFLVGPKENIFHSLKSVTQFETAAEMIKAVEGYCVPVRATGGIVQPPWSTSGFIIGQCVSPNITTTKVEYGASK